MAAGICRLGHSRPGRKDVITTRWHIVGKLLPRLAQLALEPVADNRIADGFGHGEAEARCAGGVVFTREPVQGEISGRDRPALSIDRIEVLRPRQAVPALHRQGGRSGGEALAPLGATALEDRLSGTRRHAGAKTVLALAATDVGLVRAFHSGALFVSDSSAATCGRGASV